VVTYHCTWASFCNQKTVNFLIKRKTEDDNHSKIFWTLLYKLHSYLQSENFPCQGANTLVYNTVSMHQYTVGIARYRAVTKSLNIKPTFIFDLSLDDSLFVSLYVPVTMSLSSIISVLMSPCMYLSMSLWLCL